MLYSSWVNETEILLSFLFSILLFILLLLLIFIIFYSFLLIGYLYMNTGSYEWQCGIEVLALAALHSYYLNVIGFDYFLKLMGTFG